MVTICGKIVSDVQAGANKIKTDKLANVVAV